jgi:hypothetical protein
MKITMVVFCGVSLFGFSLAGYQPSDQRVARSFHLNRVFLDVDRVSEGKLWFRVNNDSDVGIWIRGLASPAHCEDYPEYYLERVAQRRFSDTARKDIVRYNPSFAGKTDDEIANLRPGVPRTVTMVEQREMNWSDAIAAGCGTLGPKHKASFQVPLSVARDYDRVYVTYYQEDGDGTWNAQIPEHRLYFDLSSLKAIGIAIKP